MKKLDIFIQSLIIGVALLLIVNILVFTTEKSAALLVILYMQLLLGPWQVVSGVIKLIVYSRQPKDSLYNGLQTYGILVVMYGAAYTLIPANLGSLLIYYLTVIPCLLATYYYYLTLMDLKKQNASNSGLGKFLPHTGF